MAKDNFSEQSKEYARFRPGYPAGLVECLTQLCPGRSLAWDCGAGNGQFAVLLAEKFAHVHATDISPRQLEQAIPRPNIRYAEEPAERCSLPDQSCDLITVAQAIHWFDFDRFYAEVRRVARPGAVIAAVGYALFRSTPLLNRVIDRFYTDIVGPYWDPERRWVDEHYKTIPFPFQEIEIPVFAMEYAWSPQEMTGYFGTWSATRHYIRDQGTDPAALVEEDLAEAWPGTEKAPVRFEICVRVGRVWEGVRVRGKQGRK